MTQPRHKIKISGWSRPRKGRHDTRTCRPADLIVETIGKQLCEANFISFNAYNGKKMFTIHLTKTRGRTEEDRNEQINSHNKSPGNVKIFEACFMSDSSRCTWLSIWVSRDWRTWILGECQFPSIWDTVCSFVWPLSFSTKRQFSGKKENKTTKTSQEPLL